MIKEETSLNVVIGAACSYRNLALDESIDGRYQNKEGVGTVVWGLDGLGREGYLPLSTIESDPTWIQVESSNPPRVR